MTETEFTIYEYTDATGHSPYASWLKKLKDKTAKAKIILQIERMSLGLFGDSKPIGGALVNSGFIMDRAIACITADWKNV